jgi:kynureninase
VPETTNHTGSIELEQARDRDGRDPLARFRDYFYCKPGTIYLDGNSLGLLSRQAKQSVLRTLEEWETLAIDGWLEGEPAWFGLAEQLAAQIAPLIGASPDEVLVANSTTVNLHQLLATVFEPKPGRDVILADALNFPSDLYAIRSHLKLRGLDYARCLRLVTSSNGLTLDEDDIVDAMTSDVALIVLPSVLYASGQLLDVERLAEEARRRNIMVGFDCSHSIGAIPHALDNWDVDFAFWCSYKYLNSGPGATGGLYLNRRHFGRSPGLAGWFGCCKSRQFDMSLVLDPAPDAGMLHIGTPNILSLAPLEGSLRVVHEAGIDRIRCKSLELTEYLMSRVDVELGAFGIDVVNPREGRRRGGHVSLAHPEATRICKALKAAGVVPDFRPPNIVRLAPVALYTSFEDCYRAIEALKSIMQSGAYRSYASVRDLVA